MKFWSRNGHNSDLRTIAITVSTDELMQLETEAGQEQMSVPEYLRAKLFAADLTPRIQQAHEQAQRINRQMTQIAETLEKMAALEDKRGTE
jgi:hypothetical protein